IAVLGGSIFNFFFSFLMLRRKLKIRISFRWDMELIKKFLKIAVPFAIAAIFVKIYTFTDRYMLLFIAGQSYVGWYVTAHKLTYALEFIPSAFGVSIFPALSEYYVSSKEKLAKTFENAMHYLIVLSVPISVGIFILAEKIVVSLYGEVFRASVTPLRILIVGLVVIFLNFPVGAFLNACNKQVINTRNMGITVLINIVLNIFLIKQYTFNGAAVAALISGIVLFFLGLRWVGKVIKYNKKFLLQSLGRALFAGLIMGIVLFLLVGNVDISFNEVSSKILKNITTLASLGIYVLAGAFTYFLTLYLIGGITKNDFSIVYNKFLKRGK
ncbi:MAG: oligosaccharide flippase family protein, partial [Candidatus Helarchaeota archaeon]